MKDVLRNYGSWNSSDASAASAELTFLGCVRTYFLTRPAPKTNPSGTKTGAQDGHGQIYSFRIRFAAGSAPRKDEKRREEALNLYSKTKKQHFLRHVYLLEIDMAIWSKSAFGDGSSAHVFIGSRYGNFAQSTKNVQI